MPQTTLTHFGEEQHQQFMEQGYLSLGYLLDPAALVIAWHPAIAGVVAPVVPAVFVSVTAGFARAGLGDRALASAKLFNLATLLARAARGFVPLLGLAQVRLATLPGNALFHLVALS